MPGLYDNVISHTIPRWVLCPTLFTSAAQDTKQIFPAS